jgi:hypothetical protein
MTDTQREKSPPLAAGAAVALAAVVFAADCVSQLNLSILYVIPLVAVGRTRNRRRLFALAAILVAAAFLGYVIKASLVLAGHGPPVISYRLLNRTLVASVIVVTAFVLGWLYGGQQEDEPRGKDDFDELLESLRPMLLTSFAAFIAAPLLAIAILAADVLVPGQYNLPILYGLPIVLISSVGSERLMWGAAVILSGLSLVGYFAGPAPEVAHGFETWAIVNRVLAVFAVVGLAILLRPPRRYRSSDHEA